MVQPLGIQARHSKNVSWRGRTRQWSPYSRVIGDASKGRGEAFRCWRTRRIGAWGSVRNGNVEIQGRGETAQMTMFHVDWVKELIASFKVRVHMMWHCATVLRSERTTLHVTCQMGLVVWCSHGAVPSHFQLSMLSHCCPRHAAFFTQVIHVVFGNLFCDASCHQAIMLHPLLWISPNLVPALIFLSDLYQFIITGPVAMIGQTFCYRENTSFELSAFTSFMKSNQYQHFASFPISFLSNSACASDDLVWAANYPWKARSAVLFESIHEGFSVQTEYSPFPLERSCTLSNSRFRFTFRRGTFLDDLKVTQHLAQDFPVLEHQINVPLGSPHAWYVPENQKHWMGWALTSRSWENNGEVNCPTSVVSVISDAATVVAKSLKSVSKLSFLAKAKLIGVRSLAHCWLQQETSGLITCERALFGQAAKEETSLRRSAGFPNSVERDRAAKSSSHRKRCKCRKWSEE